MAAYAHLQLQLLTCVLLRLQFQLLKARELGLPVPRAQGLLAWLLLAIH